MKFNKSMLSIMLIASMSTTVITPSIVFASTMNYSNSIKKIQQLGIIDGSTSNQDEIVTRGQFVRAIAVSDGLVDPSSDLNGTSMFPDITPNTELCYNINVVVNAGIMNSTSDGLFHPELGVTYAEACTIMVRLLGYSNSDVPGVWPNNYIKKAYDLKITTGITLKKGDKLTLKTEALMFDRLLDTLVKKTNGSEDDKYFSAITNAIDYSNPQVVSDYKPRSYEIGDIQFDETTPIMKSGKVITKEDIKNNDVVYNVTDIYGKNKKLVVFSNLIEGNITAFKITGSTPTSLEIDKTNYAYGEDLDVSTISSFAVGDLVSAVLGYDGKIVQLKGVKHKSGDYTDPQVVSNYNPSSYVIGNIKFGAKTPIMKNGANITKKDIKNNDVVYSINDVYGKSKKLVVFSNKIEGNITAFQMTGSAPASLQIDNANYSFSEYMDVPNTASFGVGQLVSAILGYNGQIVQLKGIEHKSGTIVECKLLGNYKTTDNLLQNQVLTDKGIYKVDSSVPELELGIKYKLSIDGNTILGIKESENTIECYPVTEVDGSTITYVQDKTKNTMTLPEANEYYYHGVAVNYSAASSAVQPYSSIILSKEKGTNGYTYAVIIDPYFTAPQVYTPTNIELAKAINDIKYDYVYKNGYTVASNVIDRDLVYFVSDVWNQNKFVYLYSSIVVGEVSALLPSKINPTSITINKVSYTFSAYLSKTSVNNYKNTINIGDTKTLVLGIDGKIVNIY